MLSHTFDDLRVGAALTTRGRTITETDVVAFAAHTGDWHPQHTDAEWSAGSPFGERIAHGLLVLSSAVGALGFDPERVIALRRIGDAVFKRPVRLGDTIRAEAQVTELAPVSGEAGLVTLALRILNQRDELVVRARAEVLWRRAAGREEPEVAPEIEAFVPIPL